MSKTKNKGGAPLNNNNAGRGRQATHALEMLVRHFDKNGLDPIDWENLPVIEASKTLMRLWEPQVRSAFGQGDKGALQLIIERLDGKPRQAVDLGGQEENPISTSVNINFKPVGRDGS